MCPPPQVRLVQLPCRLVNDCQITLPNITLSRPHVSGCHSLSACYFTDGCTCAYTPNKHGPGDLDIWLANERACQAQLDTVCAGEIQAATRHSLEVCGAESSSSDGSSLLFGHSDISHYQMVIHAFIYSRDGVQVLRALMPKSLVSSRRLCFLTEPCECEWPFQLHVRRPVCF